MEIGIKERVEEWAKSGGDFGAGLSLFLSFNRNAFYARNIEAKGIERGMVTLVSEFSNKTKLPAMEIWGLIKTFPIASKGVTSEVVKVEAQSVCLIADKEQHKKRMKLREEFPFLGRKDCPEELAVLVNKMLTAYDDYRSDREKLFEVDTNNPKECYQSAREVLDAYVLNREIWEELNYYKLHGKILGKMPEFRIRGLREKFSAMSTVNLVKITNNNIPRKMSYYKKQLSSSDTKNKMEIRAKISEREDELSVIRKILIERGEI